MNIYECAFFLSKFGFIHLHFSSCQYRVSQKKYFSEVSGFGSVGLFGIIVTILDSSGPFWTVVMIENGPTSLKPKFSEKYFFRHPAFNVLTAH